jgi:hypothetical protein
MIEMLNAGVSIGALLGMISCSLSHEALEFTQQRQGGVHLRQCPVAHSAGGTPMGCLECKNLEEAFESRLSQYIDARSAAYYRVTTELAACSQEERRYGAC